MGILYRRHTTLIAIIRPAADLPGAMNTNQLIANHFMLIRVAIIALDLALLAIMGLAGMAAAAGIRRFRRAGHAFRGNSSRAETNLISR
jgi:hypothetical protein